MPDTPQTPSILSPDQHQFYADNGYLVLERVIADRWIQALRQAASRIVQQSRAQDRSDAEWRLGKAHSARAPRLLGLANPDGHQEIFWDYLVQSILPDILTDLLGPHVKFHHAELQFEPAEDARDDVTWRQDIPRWPHTNYSPCTVVTHLYECNAQHCALRVLPGSHAGDLFVPVNGRLSPEDAAGLDLSRAVPLTVPGGSVTIHNCRLVYGFGAGGDEPGRPVLWSCYSAADAFPYGETLPPSPHAGTVVRGEPARWARHDPRPCPVPIAERASQTPR